MDANNPLTDEHCRCLDQVLDSIRSTRDLVSKCKNCGMDVSRAEDELNAQEQLATRLKQQFFPNKH